MKSQNEMWERYVKNFFTILKEDEPELYIKTMRLCRAGKGDAVRDILWEVIREEL